MFSHLRKILVNDQQGDRRFQENVPLGKESWFGCGGTADVLFQPEDIDDLALFLKDAPPEMPVTVMGGMANIIVRDGGVRGCVIRLGKPFSDIDVKGARILAGAGALNGSVASAAAKAGIGGLEFLSGIPGTVGGAVRMNAGAYGREIKDVLVAAFAIDRKGRSDAFMTEDMDMRYRYCGVPEGTIFTAAAFEGVKENKEVVRARLKEIKEKRRETQPITEKTGGSTFANPTEEQLKAAGLESGLRAWQLIERVGGRGLTVGGAKMSEKHCNFMINTGTATAADLEDLGEELIRRVKTLLGVTLHWEIRRIGDRPPT
ncbi:MAG: UDP-N-acetylmuramate dehydrogenase [Rhodospirillales bacterium]|nr:UDP-N-acetylmuramate dehydrogenase [Alphaproteobacteria bacterium]MCB9976389.1 UDP-N-acetylmuramate dehydrogenase [Rhodospirillales bacterium]